MTHDQPDPRTGIQIHRRLALGAASSRIQRHSRSKCSDRTVCWSIWHVVQRAADMELPGGEHSHDPSCCVTAPVNPHSRFDRGFNVMFGAEDNPQWGSAMVCCAAANQWDLQDRNGLGLRPIAFHRGSKGFAFVERFVYVPGGEYPDGGASVECWTVGAGQVSNLDYAGSGIYLMETEVLSPMYTIPPGTSASFALEWASCACATGRSWTSRQAAVRHGRWWCAQKAVRRTWPGVSACLTPANFASDGGSPAANLHGAIRWAGRPVRLY